MKKLLSLVMLATSVVGARAELLYIDVVRSGSAPRKEVFADESAARPCSQECRDYESITLRFVNDGSEVVYTISYGQVQELGLNFLHMLCCDLVPLAGPLDLEERNHRGQLRYPDLSAESFGLIMRLHKEGYDHEAEKFTAKSFDNFLRTVVDEGLKAGRPVLGCKTPLTLAFKLARVLDTFGSVEPVRLLMEVAMSNEYLAMTTAADAEIIKQMAWSVARHIDTAFIPCALVPNFKEEKILSGHVYSILSIAWSPDGKYLASAGNDGFVCVWNIEDKTRSLLIKDHTGWIRSIAWSPDGKYLASAGEDRIVRVWNIENETSTEFKGHTGWIRSIAWSPDGKFLASAGREEIVRIWNIEDETCTLLKDDKDWIRSIAWSPDGKYLASAGDDRIVRVWNIGGKTCTLLKDDTDQINSIAWSPDGKYLASAGKDEIVRVWSNEALDKCSFLQKLFILMNLPKKLKMFERVSLRAGDDEPIAQWLGVYQSLPEQAKKILDKDVQEKFENLSLSKVLAFGTEKTRKDCTKSLVTIALKSFGESVFRKIGFLMLQNKPSKEVRRFFDQHEKEFGDRAEDVLSDIARYVDMQAKERGDGASSSDASSSKP